LAWIGETRSEIDRRYGEGKRDDLQRLEGAEIIQYHFNNVEIEVVFHDHKSICEFFHGNLAASDLKVFLKANTGGPDGLFGSFYHHRIVTLVWGLALIVCCR